MTLSFLLTTCKCFQDSVVRLCDSRGSYFELSRAALARLQAATVGPVRDDDHDPGLIFTTSIANLERFVANANDVAGLARPGWLGAGPITADIFVDNMMAYFGAVCSARLENSLEMADGGQQTALGARMGVVDSDPFVQASMAGGPAGVIATPLFTVRGVRRSGNNVPSGLVFQPYALGIPTARSIFG